MRKIFRPNRMLIAFEDPFRGSLRIGISFMGIFLITVERVIVVVKEKPLGQEL